MNNRKKSKPLVILCLWLLLIYFPTYLLGPSNSQGQILFFVTYLTVLAFTLLCLIRHRRVFIPINETGIVFIVFTLVLVTFIPKFYLSNITELINHSRFLFYGLVFLLFVNILLNSNLSSKQLKKGMDVTILTLLIFNILHLLAPTYISIINPRPIWGFRGISVGGPFVWSYIFSFFLIPLFYLYFHLLTSNFKLKDFFLLLCILIFMLLGQSKSCFIALIFTLLNYFLIAFFMKIKNRKKIYLAFLFFIGVITCALVALPELFSAIINGFTSLLSGDNDASTSGRLRQIEIVLSTLENESIKALIFGVNEPKAIIENAFFSYFYKYGLIGLLSLIFFYIYTLVLSYKYVKLSMKSNYNAFNQGLVIGFNAMTLSLIFFSLGSSPVDANKSSYFFFLAWALIMYIIKENKRNLSFN